MKTFDQWADGRPVWEMDSEDIWNAAIAECADEMAELLALLCDCESYAYAMGTLQGSGEGAQLAARCRELIAKAEGKTESAPGGGTKHYPGEHLHPKTTPGMEGFIPLGSFGEQETAP